MSKISTAGASVRAGPRVDEFYQLTKDLQKPQAQ